ncbi:MAG TPA: SRPBCC family protein [Actinomycetota bacterium]|nr:SRPBCC family protein [Actinomycetota bacterium]
MLIENEFTVATPVDELWAFLLDVERIAPCMPGAELTETIDDSSWKGKVNVKFGPVALSFAGTVEMTERDDAAHRAALHAKGMEQKGKGAANATVTSWLEPASDGQTTVKMAADIALTGAAAQLSRGLLPEISRKLTQQFADCLQAQMQMVQAPAPVPAATPAGAAEEVPAATVPTPAPAPVAAKHVGGIGLGLSAIWAVIKNFFRKLFGGGKTPT